MSKRLAESGFPAQSFFCDVLLPQCVTMMMYVEVRSGYKPAKQQKRMIDTQRPPCMQEHLYFPLCYWQTQSASHVEPLFFGNRLIPWEHGNTGNHQSMPLL